MLTSTSNFRNERYHRAEDTYDTLDYERLSAWLCHRQLPLGRTAW